MTAKFNAGITAIGLAGLLAIGLVACEKGPDRAAVAAQLKSDVEAQLQIIEGSTAQKVVSHTAVTVTPADDGRYQVAIEGLKFAPSAEGYLDIGTVGYVAAVKDEKTYDIADLKLAPEIPFKGADGKEKGKLTLATKSFSGQWSRELSVFQKMSAEFADIVAVDDKSADLRIASVKVDSELVDKGGGTFDARGAAAFGGFEIREAGNDGVFSIGEVVADALYDSVKVAEYQAAAKKYQQLVVKQLADTEAATKAGGQAPAMTAEDQQALSAAIGEMAAALKGGTFKMTFKTMKYVEAGATPFSLDQATLGTTIDGINQEKASFTFDIGHQGLAVNAPEASGALAKAVLPKAGNLGLRITEIPSKDLTKMLADNLPGMMSADAAMAEANAMAMMVALQAVLQTSGAKIEVTPSAVTAEMTEVKADGTFDVTSQSIFGVAGALNVAWTGLDEVMALAQANPADPSAQNVIGVVSMLMQYARRETGADGKPVDKFKIDVKETGELLVNDKPM